MAAATIIPHAAMLVASPPRAASGIARETLILTACLALATLVCVFVGRLAVARIGERGFRIVVSVLPAITSLSLIVNSLAGMPGYV